ELWNQIYQHTLLTPRRQFIQILDRNNDLLYRSPSLGKQRIDYSEFPYKSVELASMKDSAGRELRLAVTQNDFVKIIVAYPLEDLNDILGNLFSTFLVLSPLALAVSLVGGWFLAHQSLKPVDVITRAAREISLQNLSQRLPVRPVDDELTRLTSTFNDMIERLESSFEQVQKFSADASHELRTPLTIMRGEIEVALRGGTLAPEARQLLTSVHDELLRLSSIVDSLITLMKSDAGRLSFQFEDLDLDVLLKAIWEDTQILAEPKNISVRFGMVEPVRIHGDPSRLQQLFLNLAENAVKYTPPKGAVTLSLERADGTAVVRVSDNGIGIPARDQSKIFQRFYRIERIETSGVSGSGLGLAIAKWIAEAHKGTIEVQSKVNKGTTFIVTLPLPVARPD
ncbi:MAG TPA: ATP-binding protein, partial [Bacteroidota bacterium]